MLGSGIEGGVNSVTQATAIDKLFDIPSHVSPKEVREHKIHCASSTTEVSMLLMHITHYLCSCMRWGYFFPLSTVKQSEQLIFMHQVIFSSAGHPSNVMTRQVSSGTPLSDVIEDLGV